MLRVPHTKSLLCSLLELREPDSLLSWRKDGIYILHECIPENPGTLPRPNGLANHSTDALRRATGDLADVQAAHANVSITYTLCP